jgi:hypothetical protein
MVVAEVGTLGSLGHLIRHNLVLVVRYQCLVRLGKRMAAPLIGRFRLSAPLPDAPWDIRTLDCTQIRKGVVPKSDGLVAHRIIVLIAVLTLVGVHLGY